MPLPRSIDYSLRFITPISLVIGIVGLYHYYESVQERVPTYYVSPTRARLVDVSIPAPPQLQVLYKGKDLNTNVTSLRLYFWNAGKLPIKVEDVLEPVRIELDPECRIIDSRVLKVSREVISFTNGDVSDTARNVLPVSFRILERNDGAAMQIIFSGKADTKVSVRGTIVGARDPQQLAPDEMTFEAEALKKGLNREQSWGTILVSLGASLIGALIVWLIPHGPRPLGSPPKRINLGVWMIFVLLLSITLTGFGWYLNKRANRGRQEITF